MQRVVTIGGGHGQAALLAGLLHLDVDITAIAGVADDGGCSGRLRTDFGMPPPGDLRRCLTTLAADRALAELYEGRIDDRSAGNLALRQAYAELGTLQAAADWAAARLRCRGRVVPAAEHPGQLAIYDRTEGELEGETRIAARGTAPMVVAVHGVEHANPVALDAITGADHVFIGPGSFVTSILATIVTGEVAEALVATRATRVLMHNLVPEPGLNGHSLRDHLRLLRDHVCIKTGAPDLPLVVMCHGPEPRLDREGHDPVHVAPIADPDAPGRHDPARVAIAVARCFDLPVRARPTAPP